LRKLLRVFRWISFSFLLSGCSYQQMALPDNPEPVEEVGGDLPVVKVRQKVRILTHDGSTHDGEVVSVTPDRIVIGKPGNFGYTETPIAASDIAEIKTEKNYTVVTVVAASLAVVFALFVAMASQVEFGPS